jgi:hypothetical protein
MLAAEPEGPFRLSVWPLFTRLQGRFGSATGKQPRMTSHFVTKTGKTPAFMRVWMRVGNFTNCSKNSETGARKTAPTVTHRDTVEKRGTTVAASRALRTGIHGRRYHPSARNSRFRKEDLLQVARTAGV